MNLVEGKPSKGSRRRKGVRYKTLLAGIHSSRCHGQW